MNISLDTFRTKVPLPATDTWPAGVWDIEAFAHGTMSVVFFAPRGVDHQTSHAQDELYIVVSGNGVLVVGDARSPFEAGDVLFVRAGQLHRFEDFSDDLVTWAVFWGPKGGET